MNISAVLDDDVRMGLKDRDHFFRSRDLFPPENAGLCLPNHSMGQGQIPDQFHKVFQNRGAIDTFESFHRPLGVAGRLTGYLDQIPIQGLPGFVVLGINDAHHPAFGPANVVLIGYAVPLLAAFFQQAAQYPHTVKKQTRIAGGMNIGLDHRAVDPNLASLVDLFRLGPIQQHAIDSLPCGRADPGNVVLKGGVLEGSVGKANAHEAADRFGIRDMKGQIPISVTIHLLDQSSSQYLLGGHTVGPAFLPFLVLAKVLVNQIEYGIIPVKYVTDGLQLHGFRMINNWRRQRQLFFT